MATRSSLGEHLAAAQYVLVLIGAGVSSPSGIPTYRGESSCGNDNALITPLTFSYYPDQVWEYFTRKRRTAIGALPNPAHYAIARLARDKEHVFAITQNIDGKLDKHYMKDTYSSPSRSFPKSRPQHFQIGRDSWLIV